ncbi:MAG: hypothetical protein MUE69_34590 [Myxococcota bacterium]|nr:hypothetical protein [Myxococcota bacterium]
MRPKTRDLINISAILGCTVLTTAAAMCALHDEGARAGAVLFVFAFFFGAITLGFVSEALFAAELRGEKREADRAWEHAQERDRRWKAEREKLDEQHQREREANAAIYTAIDAAAERAIAAGKRRDVRAVIDRWREGQDETLARTLRDLEALTGPVAEA